MPRLHGLDALRGAAALLVVWFHLNHAFEVGFYPLRGYLAVDFFFMLSGYVMARTYEGRLRGGMWFLRKRLQRLWPTVAAGSLLGLPLLYQHYAGADFLLVAVLNLLLIPTLWAGAAFPLNSPMWSIFFELVANAVHGTWLHRVSTKVLSGIVAASGSVALVIALQVGSYSVGSNATDFVGGFPRVIFAYFLGVILWRWWRDKPPVRIHAATLLPLTAMLFTPREPITDFLFVAVACPAIMAIGITARPGRWASYAGDLSFPLYAVHRPVLGGAVAIGASPLVGAASSILIAAALLFVLGLNFRKKPQSRPVSAEREAELAPAP